MISLVSTERVALTVAEIERMEVVRELVFNERLMDDRLSVVDVARLKPESETEVEPVGRLGDKPVFMLVDGKLTEVHVPRSDVGRVTPVLIEVLDMLSDVLGSDSEGCVFRDMLGRLKDVLGRLSEVSVLSDVLGRLKDVDMTLRDVVGNEIPVSTLVLVMLSDGVRKLKDVLGKLKGI